MEYENAIETLNLHVEEIIVKNNNDTINALERLRIKYLAKIELIGHQIKRAEQNFLNNLSNELKDATPIELVVKKVRGRPRKIYPVIMPEIIINDIVIDTYEVKLEPLIVKDECNDQIESEFSVE
jgi:hypothetical protein